MKKGEIQVYMIMLIRSSEMNFNPMRYTGLFQIERSLRPFSKNLFIYFLLQFIHFNFKGISKKISPIEIPEIFNIKTITSQKYHKYPYIYSKTCKNSKKTIVKYIKTHKQHI